MILGLQLLSVIAALVAIGLSMWAHRSPKTLPASRWSSRASVVLSVGMIIGTVPGMLFPSSSSIRIGATLVSFVFTIGAFAAIRHGRRALRSTAAHDARR
jgi:hypothetical protein